MVDKEKLRKAQLIMLEILEEVDYLCKREGLRYWLDSGTLLGAVRHRGFIPWDDDLDICMPVEDYEIFLKIAQEKLPRHLFVQTKKTDKKFPRDFAKVRTSKGYILEKIEFKKSRKGYHQGIYIDIFPCMTVREGWERKLYLFLSWCKAYIGERYTGSNTIRWFFIEKTKKLHKGWDDPDLLVVRSLEFVEPQLCVRVRDVFPLKLADFEGKKFPIPSNSDAYLKTLYGDDYMQLPPPEKRISHAHTIEIYE